MAVLAHVHHVVARRAGALRDRGVVVDTEIRARRNRDVDLDGAGFTDLERVVTVEQACSRNLTRVVRGGVAWPIDNPMGVGSPSFDRCKGSGEAVDDLDVAEDDVAGVGHDQLIGEAEGAVTVAGRTSNDVLGKTDLRIEVGNGD